MERVERPDVDVRTNFIPEVRQQEHVLAELGERNGSRPCEVNKADLSSAQSTAYEYCWTQPILQCHRAIVSQGPERTAQNDNRLRLHPSLSVHLKLESSRRGRRAPTTAGGCLRHTTNRGPALDEELTAPTCVACACPRAFRRTQQVRLVAIATRPSRRLDQLTRVRAVVTKWVGPNRPLSFIEGHRTI